MVKAPMTVVETPFFLRKAATLKVRWAAQGRGKSGGFRVIYYFHSETFPAVSLNGVFQESKANLTKAERNEFKKLIPLLVKTYAKGRKR